MTPPNAILSEAAQRRSRMIWLRRAGAAALVLTAFAVAGCIPKGQPPTGKILYSGPTDAMSVVLAKVRRNNAAVETLWSRHDFEATIYDDKGHSHYVAGNGLLTYRKPHNFRLDGDVAGAGRVFQLGSNDDRFWATIGADVDTMYWAHWQNADKACAKPMPVRPDLVVEVLGITDIPDDMLTDPTPVMRYNNAADAYMIVWSTKGPDQYYPVKEIWYDRATLQPRMVNLFDPRGRITLRAYLSKFKPVPPAEGETPAPNTPRPTIATHYDLLFPETRDKMVFDLRNPVSSYKGAPNDRTFRFPDNPDVSKVDQIDANCPP